MNKLFSTNYNFYLFGIIFTYLQRHLTLSCLRIASSRFTLWCMIKVFALLTNLLFLSNDFFSLAYKIQKWKIHDNNQKLYLELFLTTIGNYLPFSTVLVWPIRTLVYVDAVMTACIRDFTTNALFAVYIIRTISTISYLLTPTCKMIEWAYAWDTIWTPSACISNLKIDNLKFCWNCIS